jgi:hypothetical protein
MNYLQRKASRKQKYRRENYLIPLRRDREHFDFCTRYKKKYLRKFISTWHEI